MVFLIFGLTGIWRFPKNAKVDIPATMKCGRCCPDVRAPQHRTGLKMTVVNSGGCVCGANRFKASGEPLRVTICHCKWCQRRTGTAFGVEVVYNSDQVNLTGDEMRQYRHVSDESGRWLDLQFCGKCGGNLGFTLEAAPGIRTLPAGAFDDPAWINADHYKFRHVFTRSRRVWSELSSNVEIYEEHFRS